MKIYRAYLRTSTNTQREKQTIQVQQSQIDAFAKANGFQITQWYKDDGISGSEENRPALVDMLRDSKLAEKEGHDQNIVVVSLSRIGRELRIQERVIHDMKNMGINLLSVTEPDLGSSQMERVLLRQIVGAVAEYDKKQIVAKLHSGRKHKASKGEYAGGRLGLGFKLVGGKVIQDKEQVETVRLIFKLRRCRTKKYSYAMISRELNELNYKNARGKEFTAQGVRGVLNADRNKGIMKYGENKIKVNELKIKAVA